MNRACWISRAWHGSVAQAGANERRLFVPSFLRTSAPLAERVRRHPTRTTMFSKIVNMRSPSPLSEKWLAVHAARYSRVSFELDSKRSGALPIYHVSNRESAQSIYATGKIFGVDVVSSAHFHHTPEAASRQAAADGVILGFIWSGAVTNVDLSNDASTHRDRRPNILFDVPIAAYDNQTWELRLYPGTAGLLLVFVEIAGTGYLLRGHRKVEVVQGG